MKWTDLKFFGEGDKVVANKLAESMNAGDEIFPPVHQIMRAFDLTPFDKVKVVILGQDPYPTAGHANGLAFSVNACVEPLPKSLQNIFKELEDDLGVKRNCGSLRDWADQGVLLINNTLTVEAGKAGSHQGWGWEALTDEVITTLNEKRNGLVFVMWGKKAQEKASLIDPSKHYTIQSPHPSPLSAYRGFFGSKPFSRINNYLRKSGQTEIKWK
jgi:uracil-DNA glycosylase